MYLQSTVQYLHKGMEQSKNEQKTHRQGYSAQRRITPFTKDILLLSPKTHHFSFTKTSYLLSHKNNLLLLHEDTLSLLQKVHRNTREHLTYHHRISPQSKSSANHHGLTVISELIQPKNIVTRYSRYQWG